MDIQSKIIQILKLYWNQIRKRSINYLFRNYKGKAHIADSMKKCGCYYRKLINKKWKKESKMKN